MDKYHKRSVIGFGIGLSILLSPAFLFVFLFFGYHLFALGSIFHIGTALTLWIYACWHVSKDRFLAVATIVVILGSVIAARYLQSRWFLTNPLPWSLLLASATFILTQRYAYLQSTLRFFSWVVFVFFVCAFALLALEPASWLPGLPFADLDFNTMQPIMLTVLVIDIGMLILIWKFRGTPRKRKPKSA